MKTYPQQTANCNVPADAFLVAEISAMSGEIVTTYFIMPEGDIRKVTDWKGDKAIDAFPFEICRLTGDTPQMIEARWRTSQCA